MPKEICFLIACHDEQSSIHSTLTSILSQAPSSPVLVCANACRDQTIPIIQQLAGKHSEIHLFIEAQQGKARALNLLVHELFSNPCYEGVEYVFFCDADILLEKKCIPTILREFQNNPSLMAVGARMHSIASPANLPEKILQKLDVVGMEKYSFQFLSGPFYCIRKSALKDVVFPEDIILDDIYLSLKLGREKIRISEEAICYFSSPKTIPDFYEQKTRQISGVYELQKMFSNKNFILFLLELSEQKPVERNWSSFSLKTKLFVVFGAGVYAILFVGGFVRYHFFNSGSAWKPVKSTKELNG